MDNDNSSAELNQRLSETESSLTRRELSPGKSKARAADNRQPPQSPTEPKQLKIVVQIAPAEPLPDGSRTEGVKAAASPVLNPPSSEEAKSSTEPPLEVARQIVRVEAEPQQIPARMMNEFVYCQRLFYYEFVEGVFVESVDTLRGAAIHQRVDSGNGALPAAKRKSKAEKTTTEDKPPVVDNHCTRTALCEA